MAVPAPLSPEQQAIIKATVPVLVQHGDAITTLFYRTMLAENPSLNNIFNAAHQRSGHQARALAGSLLAYATHIDDLAKLSGLVELVCNKHASLHIQPEHYDIVGRYLLAAMGTVLGDALTPDILGAWAAAYGQLAGIMIAREEQMYRQVEAESMGSKWRDWRDFRVAKKVPESDEITSFYLEPVDGKPLPAFLPGQYISVQLTVPGLEYKQARQYSLSERPVREYYRISVKREAGSGIGIGHPGYVSNLLHDNVEAGGIVSVSAPHGDFFFDAAKTPDDSPVVLLSAGVGLTCLMSILSSLAAAKTTRPISFIHVARTSSARAFGKHVRMLASENIRPLFYCTAPGPDEVQGKDYDRTGRLALAGLDGEKDLHLGDKATEYFVCGPERFMVEMRSGLEALGVDAERVHVELFGTGGVPMV